MPPSERVPDAVVGDRFAIALRPGRQAAVRRGVFGGRGSGSTRRRRRPVMAGTTPRAGGSCTGDAIRGAAGTLGAWTRW
jgi:hypothetical protein